MAPALAARRASDVLRHLARHPDQQLTLSELASALDVAPAALHGVVTALTEGGYLSALIPEAYGGLGLDDFRFDQILIEELTRVDSSFYMLDYVRRVSKHTVIGAAYRGGKPRNAWFLLTRAAAQS